jgi:class 3 adenylate cyclase
LSRLVERLLVTAEKAAAQGAWDGVEEILHDVLAVAPGNRRATAMLQQAGIQQSLSGGQRALVSLLFSDIVRSTDMAEHAEPEIIRDLFRMYRDVASDAIGSMEGNVLQFQGDGIVACFGHPKAHGDDAQRAVLAGLGIVDGMAKIGARIRQRLGVEAPVRVGVHTGTVVTGFSSGAGRQPDVVGAATNLAARLQAVAEPGTVVISDVTRTLVEQSFELAPLGKRALKGIAEPVEVFRVARARPVDARLEAVKLHSAALIGREGVQRRLRALWDRVRQASERGEAVDRSLAVLRGPPGIGKSRVAADLCTYARGQGGSVAPAACSPFHTNVAMWPIARLVVRQLGMHVEQPPEERIGILRRRAVDLGFDSPTAVPLVASMLGLESPEEQGMSHLNPQARRSEMLKVFARWVALAAAQGPLLLVVDDLQWADPTTLDWLSLLAEAPVPGLLVLIVSREVVPTEWAEGAVDIGLEPLDEPSALALVAEIAQGVPLAAAKQRQIIERSGGIPLFVEELARSAATSRREEQLPLRLQELLAARLKAPGIDLRLAQLAATFGPVFDRILLAELVGAPIGPALARLQVAGIVEPITETRRTYRFSHVLLRDAAYETQVLEVRRDTHLRIARVLEAASERAPGDTAVVAQHFDLAGEAVEAMTAYVAAAQEDQARANNVEARRLLTRALELLHGTPESEARDLTGLMVRLLRAMSIASVLGFSHSDALEDFRAADDLCRRYRDRAELMPATMGVWLYFLTRGEHETSRAAIEGLTELVSVPEGSWFAPEVKTGLGFQELFAGNLPRARTVLEEAWEGFLERSPDAMVSSLWALPHDPPASAALCLACVTGLQGRMAESEGWRRRGRERAETIGPPRGPFSLALHSVFLAWLQMSLGDPVGACGYGRRAMEIGEQYGFDYFVAIGRPFVLTPDPKVLPDPELIGLVEPEMDTVGHRAFRPACLGNIARAYVLLGDVARALERVGDAFLLMQQSGEWIHHPDLLRLRAELTALAHPDRMDDVVADLRAAVEVGLVQGSLVLALLAANDLARLPVEARPPEWRSELRRVYDLLPPDSGCPGLVEARVLLDA